MDAIFSRRGMTVVLCENGDFGIVVVDDVPDHPPVADVAGTILDPVDAFNLALSLLNHCVAFDGGPI